MITKNAPQGMLTTLNLLSEIGVKIILFLTMFMSFFIVIYPSITLAATFLKTEHFSRGFTVYMGMLSIFIAGMLTVRNKYYFMLNRFYSRLIVVFLPLLALMVYVFVLRGHTGIYDLFNPTNILGMTERARQGLLPVSFSSLPDFPANYHQAFIILAGGLAQLAGWSAMDSLTLLFPAISALILVHLFLVSSRSQSTALGIFFLIVLFVFTSSFPHLHKDLASDNEYIIFPDIYYSNSWVIGSLTVLMISHFYWIRNIKHALQWEVIILLFCLISANATLFLAAWASVLLINLIKLADSIKKKTALEKPLLMIMALSAVFIAAHYIPSAYLKGNHYSDVGMRIKYFLPEKRLRDWEESVETLRLAGPWTLLIFFAVPQLFSQMISLFHKKILHISFPQALFLFSVFFPLFITADNIGRWDAVHKFSVATMISGFLFLVYLLREKRIKITTFYLFSLFSLILTIPNLLNFIHCRTKLTTDESWKYLPTETNRDIHNYLIAQKNRMIIYPVYEYSADGEIAKIASFSGDFVGNTYYPGFLVKVDINDYPMIDEHWSSPKKFEGYLKKTHLHTMIGIEKKKKNDFIKMLKSFSRDKNFSVKVDTDHPLIFKNYILYNYKNL